MSKIKLFNSIIVILLATVMVNCNRVEKCYEPTVNVLIPQNNYKAPAVTFKATVQGFVVNEDGYIVGNAIVQTGNKTVTADENGYFRFDDANFTGDFCYIKATKAGYFTASTTIHGDAGKEYATELVLTQPSYSVTFNANSGGALDLQNGGKVELPANGYVTSANNSYTGTITAVVKHINPEADNYGDLIPGGDLRAYDADGNDRVLYSFGMLNVELKDNQGNLLQLAAGKQATLTFPVGATQQNEAPNTIPLWYFDEYKGIWIEEGEATLQGNTYVGKVNHFTPWNVDIPHPQSTIKGKVVDVNNNPVSNIEIWIGGPAVRTSQDGTFKVLVSQNRNYNIDVFDFVTGKGIGLNKKVKALSEGQTLDIGNLVIPSNPRVVADMKNCNGSKFNGYVVANVDGNFHTELIVNSKLDFRVFASASGKEIEMTFNASDYSSYTKKTVQMPINISPSDVINLNEIKVCNKRVPDNSQEEYIEFTYIVKGEAPVFVRKVAPFAELYQHQGIPAILYFSNRAFLDSGYTYLIKFELERRPGIHNSTSLYYINNKGIDNTQMYGLGEKLNLHNYPDVGEYVTGTFSSSHVDRFISYISGGPTFKTDTVVIKNGKFRVKRGPDR